MTEAISSTPRYFVTGVTGQLGMELLRSLGESVLPRTRATCNLLDAEQVSDFIGSVRPSAVIHTAAQKSSDAVSRQAAMTELWCANVVSTDNVAKACARHGIPLILISCDQVFGGSDPHRGSPYKEASAATPTSIYGMTKIAAEHAVFRLAQCLPLRFWRSGFKFWILRVPYLIERPWEGATNAFTKTVVLSKRRKESVDLPEDVVCSPIYMPDLVDELSWLLVNQDKLAAGLYHLAGRGSTSLYLAGEAISNMTVRKPRIRVNPALASGCETSAGLAFRNLAKYSVMDCSKYAQLAGRELPSVRDTLANFARDLDDYVV